MRFESVPSFAYALDRVAPTADLGAGDGRYRLWRRVLCRSCRPIRSASICGARRCAQIVDAGEEIAHAVAKAVPIEHPDEPDLAFLYGTILTDGGDGAGAPSRNVCIFAGRQIDRSPTGSGVSARMALQVARRQARLGEPRSFESCTGAIFTGTALRDAPSVGPRKAVIVEVGGIAHVTGESRFRFDARRPPARRLFLGLSVVGAPQSLVEIGVEVVRVFHADREPQQVRRAGRARALDAGAMLDQAFDAAQRRRALPQLDARRRGDRAVARRP